MSEFRSTLRRRHREVCIYSVPLYMKIVRIWWFSQETALILQVWRKRVLAALQKSGTPTFPTEQSLHLLGEGKQILLTLRHVWRPPVSEEENRKNAWGRSGKSSWVQTISNFLQLENGLLFLKSHHEDTWIQHLLKTETGSGHQSRSQFCNT